MDISLRALEEAVGIRRQIEHLQARLSKMFGTTEAGPGRRRGQMSAAGRARIRAAQRARWAKVRKNGAAAAAPARASAPKKTRTRKRKNHLSAAGRAKISRMMKARWAARRKAQAKRR
jgi:hypothetical protein